MNTIYVGIIVLLLIILFFVLHRLDLNKAYYKYMTNKLNTLEADVARERELNTETLDRLNRVAYINPISKMGNLDYFIAETHQLFTEHPEVSYTILAFNIMNIGEINRLFGPTEGDNTVKYAAEALRDIAHHNHDLCAHVYSNMFCILGCNRSDAELITIIQELTQRIHRCRDSFQVEPAFAIYHVKDKKITIPDMINECMLAQRSIKDYKTCNYAFYSEKLEAKFEENKKMSNEMEKAMEEHKFLVYLQPIVNLRTFRITSAEALVRWDYPGRGILSPYAFIPLLESTSLVVRMDYYIWEECCKTLRRWIDNKIAPTQITVNVSPVHMENTEFIDYLDQLFEHYRVDRRLLVLEIPERAMSEIGSAANDAVRELHRRGYLVCIDNFGSLHSPLNMFRELPIDMVKIDRTFLSKNSNDNEGITILRYLIAMAKEVELQVITEGVENIDQANLMSEIGSDMAQGFFFSLPIPVREFDTLNKSMVNSVFKASQYYPTFEDLEHDLDLMDQIINRVAPAEDTTAADSSANA